MKFLSELEIVMKFAAAGSRGKQILEIGNHDDHLTRELSKKFRRVCSYYEFSKIKPSHRGNIEVRHYPYRNALESMAHFEVILLANEFHHIPDVMQMQTYDALTKDQILILFEWDYRGNSNTFYSCFQDCKPLCRLTRKILKDFCYRGFVTIKDQVKSRYETRIDDLQALIDYFKFMLPDHWRFGAPAFMKRAKEARFPLILWEGYDAFKIIKGPKRLP